MASTQPISSRKASPPGTAKILASGPERGGEGGEEDEEGSLESGVALAEGAILGIRAPGEVASDLVEGGKGESWACTRVTLFTYKSQPLNLGGSRGQ